MTALPIRTEERESGIETVTKSVCNQLSHIAAVFPTLGPVEEPRWIPCEPRTNRRFSTEEDARLTEMRVSGLSLGKIATVLNRGRSSVQQRLNMLAEREEEHFGLLPSETFCPFCNGYHVPSAPTCKAPQPRVIGGGR